MQYIYLIPGIAIFIILSLISRMLSQKIQKQLSPTDRMLFIQQISNINKYSISALIAASVIFFAGMKNLDIVSVNIFYLYTSIVIVYIIVFSIFFMKELKRLNLKANFRTSYIISRIFLLLGLGTFILTLFISFNSCNLTIMN